MRRARFSNSCGFRRPKRSGSMPTRIFNMCRRFPRSTESARLSSLRGPSGLFGRARAHFVRLPSSAGKQRHAKYRRFGPYRFTSGISGPISEIAHSKKPPRAGKTGREAHLASEREGNSRDSRDVTPPGHVAPALS
ncbi:unnamed protein product, partial [Iphiclides podalirius]